MFTTIFLFVESFNFLSQKRLQFLVVENSNSYMEHEILKEFNHEILKEMEHKIPKVE
jgi:hypothetical protein